MTDVPTIFSKDEEKDINLLITRIKKSPKLFKDRILQKLNEFSDLFQQIKSTPNQKNYDFCHLCLFFAQIYEFYPIDLRPLLESLIQLFEQSGTVLHPLLRYKIIQTLIVIKKKGFMDFYKSFNFFISIFGYSDKLLRNLVFDHFVSFMRSMSLRKELLKSETTLLNIFQTAMTTNPPEIVRRILKLLTKLYLTNVWATVKSANLIASKIISFDHKTSMMVARFLIASTEAVIKPAEDAEEDDDNFAEVKKQYSLKNKFSKKKIEKLERQMKNIKKKEHRMEKLVANSNVYPIDLIYNPSKFVDELYTKLMKDKNMKFELKQEIMCLLGRIIGRNKLIYSNYYNYVLRFIKPELKTPERLYAFIAESIHASSPMGDIEQLCTKFVDSFINEGNSEEKIIVGINFVRLAMLRNELALNSQQINIIAHFRYFKTKHVSAASKSFINVVRDLCPENLDKEFHVFNFKGELDMTVKRKQDTVGRIDGAELLNQDVNKIGVENLRVFTDDDFKKIRKLKSKKAMAKLNAEEEEFENVKRAIHMPTIDVLEARRRHLAGEIDLKNYSKSQIEDMINDPNYQELLEDLQNEDEDDEQEDGDEELGQTDSEKSGEEDYLEEDDIEFEDLDEEELEDDDEEDQDQDEEEEISQKVEKNNKNVKKQSKKGKQETEMEIESDDEEEEEEESDEELPDFDNQMQKRGFVTENMLNTKKSQKLIQEQTQLEKFEQILQRKYQFKKNQKKGSSTNVDKLKCKPAMMIVKKLQFAKRNVSAAKKRIRKDKAFVGRGSRYDTGKKKKKN